MSWGGSKPVPWSRLTRTCARRNWPHYWEDGQQRTANNRRTIEHQPRNNRGTTAEQPRNNRGTIEEQSSNTRGYRRVCATVWPVQCHEAKWQEKPEGRRQKGWSLKGPE